MDNISSFAFFTGKKIEEIIAKETDNLKEHNIMLEARILEWFYKTRDEEFMIHMNIAEFRNGKI